MDLALARTAASAPAGTHRVIVRGGYGASVLRERLTSLGYAIRGEHPSIDAVSIEVSASDLDALDAQAARDVAEAVEYAESSPEPKVEEALQDVLA